jgi:hypothetical protein
VTCGDGDAGPVERVEDCPMLEKTHHYRCTTEERENHHDGVARFSPQFLWSVSSHRREREATIISYSKEMLYAAAILKLSSSAGDCCTD